MAYVGKKEKNEWFKFTHLDFSMKWLEITSLLFMLFPSLVWYILMNENVTYLVIGEPYFLYVSFEMVILAKKGGGGWIGFIKLFLKA